MPSVVVLTVIRAEHRRCIVMLSVVMPNVVMLRVVASLEWSLHSRKLKISEKLGAVFIPLITIAFSFQKLSSIYMSDV